MLFTQAQRRFQGIPAGPAHIYDKVSVRFLRRVHREVAIEVCNALDSGSRILEFGCGTGGLMTMILRRVVVSRAVCLDISPAMTKISRGNLLRASLYGCVDIVLADAQAMPFRANSFDLVISTGTLHHIRRPEKVFGECARILGDEGEAWIYELSHDVSGCELRLLKGRFGVSVYLFRILAVMHGIPRSAYTSGYIKEALMAARVDYDLEFRGIATKLIVKRQS